MLNSEKFKSAEERRAAYEDYYEDCIKKNMTYMDKFDWLELEYKEVLPCPFCGDESVNVFKSINRDIWYVSCNKCGVRTEGDTSRELATATWNKRVE
jgi:Lar family restriction alleviation protein